MRIATVVGTVTLNRCHPSLVGAVLKVAVPQDLESLAGRAELSSDILVVYDEFGAAEGSQFALSEGGEAAQPFYPELKPVDAYNAALFDHLELRDL